MIRNPPVWPNNQDGYSPEDAAKFAAGGSGLYSKDAPNSVDVRLF